MSMLRNIYLDYNAIALRLDALADGIRNSGFGALAVILRGGGFAGLHMSFLSGLPCHFLRYDRSRGEASWVGEAPAVQNVLLCEDFAGKGRTLLDCTAFLRNGGYEVKTLVVCRDRLSASTPDYCCFELGDTDARFVLPWERHRLNPATGSGPRTDARPDHAFERTAWDMDGVFLFDVESALYRDNLEEALTMRDRASLAEFAPVVAPQDVVVTGRPVCDRERTEAWLARNRIAIPVVLRDDGLAAPGAAGVARWKGRRALELGCTHYVESEAAQALHIAALYPELRVLWWNQGHPLAVQAAPGQAGQEAAAAK